MRHPEPPELAVQSPGRFHGGPDSGQRTVVLHQADVANGGMMRVLSACLATLSMWAQTSPTRPLIVAVTAMDVEAYAQTVAGIREQFPDLEVWDARDEPRLRDRFAKTQPAVAIAVGSGAVAAVE